MYQVGDKVVYGVHGVCLIADLENRSVDRQKVQYFILEPVDHPGAKFYVPTANPAALSKLSPIMKRDELDALLADRSIPDDLWISDENRRKQQYRELICSGNRAALLAMIRILQLHKRQQQTLGKKFHLCDENFLRDAEKLLCSEFAAVLGVSAADARDYLNNHL